MSALILLAAALARPALPVLPEPPNLAICSDPIARKAFLQNPPDTSASAYNAEWAAYLDSRMENIGMSKDERERFAARVFDDPKFNAAADRGFAAARSVMADAVALMRITDEATACRRGIALMGRVPAIYAAAEEQWSVMDQALDAEAQRRAKPAE